MHLDISRHRTRNSYAIVNWVQDPQFGFFVEWGDPLMISEQEMQKSGINIILSNLNDFNLRDPLKNPASHVPRKEKIRFDRENDVVQAILDKPEVLSLQPLHRAGGGRYLGTPDESELTVTLPCEPQKFYNLLQRAFEVAAKPARPARRGKSV